MPDKTWNKLKTQSISDKDRERMRMPDIVERLRKSHGEHDQEAADEIELLREVAEEMLTNIETSAGFPDPGDYNRWHDIIQKDS